MSEELEKLLKEVGKYIRPAQEQTLFSLGGRGHYENPVSDLLAFFMAPAAEHGLGTVFLASFLKCLPKVAFQQLPTERVRIKREEATENRKRIDLVLRGTGWMMLIENKIYHWQANPFLDYKEHFTKSNGGIEPYMVVLSPDGNAKENEWMGVSYKDYCEKLRAGLQVLESETTGSKWMIFAKELILHLENELYTAPMEDKAIEFIKGHWEQVAQVQKLAQEYREFLHQELKKQLVETLGDESAWTKEDVWAIRCYGKRWGQANIAWWYDAGQTDRPICLTVYVPDPNPSQLALGKAEFETHGMDPRKEGTWIGWHGNQGFLSRSEAVIEFVRIAKVVERMFQTTEAPAEAAAARFEGGAAVSEV